MSLALSVFNPAVKARFQNHEMNRTFTGTAMNMMRATLTSMEKRSGGMTETSSVMRFFTTAGTLALGVVVAPMELTGRVAVGFIEGIIYCMLKEGSHEGAEFFKEQAITQAKAIMVAAKLWVFFSNPILDIAYVIHNLQDNAYQEGSVEFKDRFLESKLTNPERLASRNFICRYLDTLGHDPDAKAVANVSKRLFIGLLSYAVASADSAARVILNVVALPTTKLAQISGQGAINAYNMAATGAVHAFNFVTKGNREATQYDASAFANSMDVEMSRQAARVLDHGIHLGILYNPVAIAFEILDYAGQSLLLGEERGKAFDASVAAADEAAARPSAPAYSQHGSSVTA